MLAGIGGGAVLVPGPVGEVEGAVVEVCVVLWEALWTRWGGGVVVTERVDEVVPGGTVAVVWLGDDEPPHPTAGSATSANIPTCWSLLTPATVRASRGLDVATVRRL